ncbi:MAG: hypothetical protein KA369_18275 [Spirochaetes bacterium]|nr:hypothetical protein [Spirochaetota bacterium]
MKKASIIVAIILAAAALLLSGFTIDDDPSKITHKKNIKTAAIKISPAANKTNQKNLIGWSSLSHHVMGTSGICKTTPSSHNIQYTNLKFDAWSKGTFF